MDQSRATSKLHHRYDKGYKYLLSSKKLFLELLRSFVRKDWVAQVEESNLISIDKSYVLPDFREKEADLVYQAKLRDRDIIFYVLMEMQSTVDFQMPYRLLLYQTEIWRDVMANTDKVEAERKKFKLPAIVPIVLYNGASPWTANRSFRETLDGHQEFGGDLLDFTYMLIDVQRYSEEELLRLSNMIGSVFLLEQSTDLEKLAGTLHKLMNTLRKTPKELQQRFVVWFANVLGTQLLPERRLEMDRLLEQWELKGANDMMSNLEKTLEEMAKRTHRKGLEQGLERGIEQEKTAIAKNLIAKGMDDDFIADVTGLAKEDIGLLRKAVH
ncbi:Rpn family recombination-promoting nuclease/putative transposase [Paenibacillus flagellatus]|uniref:Transposase n=1 Tax=Paenibacillus flagellatus TaxID=2211139 RepID=A0A2V5KC84_9BACL|nr:Rpn family recombination-promoting nuclease/putative transposase [Paenibacillus flagellatus]PYI57098.1 transposase [Paenibacillus flagellatus]